jgi:segregation and condensation protein B
MVMMENNIESNAKQIEALLFATGSSVSIEDILSVIEISNLELSQAMDYLMSRFDSDNSGLMIRKLNAGYQLCTRPEYGDVISEYLALGQKQLLSQAAYEVLSIVAYGQPITRSKIEKIRGINSDGVVAKLIERGLIEETGKLDLPGRPSIFGTTEEFLRSFGYESISDLPEIDFVSTQLEEIDEQLIKEEEEIDRGNEETEIIIGVEEIVQL